MTAVLISRTAARLLFDEVQRWVDHGLASGGCALESLMYPLSALVPHGERLVTPLDAVRDEDIAALAIADVAIPPDSVKAFSAANCHFSGDIESANTAFNAAIDLKLARVPRLGLHSKLHAHPFEDGAFLSSGDIYHGVSAPKAVAWRQRRGLATAILHVVWPDAKPGLGTGPWRLCDDGAIGRSASGRKMVWRVHSWASSPCGDGSPSMRDLGDARVVSSRHPTLRAATRKAYWQSKKGARWCDAQKLRLREAGYTVSRNLLGRGWRRYLITVANRQLLIALPPDYPTLPPTVLEVRRAWANDFSRLELPRRWRAGFHSDSLLSLINHYGAAQPPAVVVEPGAATRRALGASTA